MIDAHSRQVATRRAKVREVEKESPIRRAIRLSRSASYLVTASKSSRYHLRRIGSPTTFPPRFVDLLDEEEAPYRICRWVAWGKWVQDRPLRFALALYLRKEADPLAPAHSINGWSWPEEYALRAAERVFQDTPQHARLVKEGILVAPGSVADLGGARLVAECWDRVWSTIRRELGSLDRERFGSSVSALASKRKKRTMRRKVALRPQERAYLDALDVIKRGLLRGAITLGELATNEKDST